MDTIIELIKNTPNDMELGRRVRLIEPTSSLAIKFSNDQELGAAVRKRIEKYRENKGKPPFTEDYTQ
jgi:hypothetical protein